MKRRAAAGLALLGALLLPGRAFAAGEKTGGIYTVVDDLLGGAAGGAALTPNGTACSVLCMAGSLGQVAASSVTAPNSSSVGAGYFDFQYNYDRLLVLLPGEELDPGSTLGKRESPGPLVIDTPFTVRVFGTDRAWNVASTAAATVNLSTSGFSTTALPLASGATVFTNMVFTSSGMGRTILAYDFFVPAATSSLVDVFDPTTSSPTVGIAIGVNSVQATLNGGISGTAADGIAVAQVRVAIQRVSDQKYYVWPNEGFLTLTPTYSPATLSPVNAASTEWTKSFADSDLSDGATYYVVAIASNSSGNVTVAQTTFTFDGGTLQSGSSGDGQGSAIVSMNSSAGCQVLVASIVFTAGPAGVEPGGVVALHLPSHWQRPIGLDFANNPPQFPGRLHVAATTAFTVDLNPEGAAGETLGPNWIAYTAVGGLSPGQLVYFRYKGFPGGGPPALGAQVFAFQTQGAPLGNLEPIAVQPSFSLIAGSSRNISFQPQQPLSVGPLQTSPTMQIAVTDGCGNSTTTTSNLVVDLLAGQLNDVDRAAIFYSSNGTVLSSSKTVVVSGANLSEGFYFRTSTTGISSEQLIATATLNSQFAFAGRYVRILGSPVALSAVSVDTGTLGAVLVATVSGHSFASPAVINFTLSDPLLRWEVVISTSAATFYPELVHRFGVGNPGRSINWSGLNERASPPSFLPPGGPYHVKISVEGGIVEDKRPEIFIGQSASIYGTVKTTGAYAFVHAQGPGTSFGNFAVASSSGYFQIYGLQAGRRYNVVATTGTVATGQFLRLTVSSNNVAIPATPASASVDIGSIPFPTPALLRVRVQIPNPAPHEFWGGINAHTADYSQFAFGTLHYSQNADNSDDGGQSFGANASSWTIIGVLPGTYDLDLNLQQIGISSTVRGVVVTGAGTTDVNVSLPRKANLYGWTVLPSTTSMGAYVSVQGTKAGERRPSAYSGTFIQGSQDPVFNTTGTFGLFGLDPGTWTITARAFGFVGVSSTVVVSTSDIGSNAVFAQGFNLYLSSGGVINGTLNLVGDSTLLPQLNGSQNGLTLFVNAYNPASFTNAGTQVRLSTSATLASSTFSISGLDDGTYFINAFIVGASPVQQSVVVAGGSGAAVLNLPVNSSRIFLTVKLPGASVAPSEYRNVALFQTGSGGPRLRQDLVGGNTVQYHVSSATWQSDALGAGYYAFTGFYGKTGMFKTISVPLSNGSTGFATLDLSGSTFTVSGNVVMAANVRFSSGTDIVSVSSVPGVIAHSAPISYCLMGSAAAVSTITFHLELLPISLFDGRFLDGSLQTAGQAGCANPPITGMLGPNMANPFLAYIAQIRSDGAFSFPGVPPGSYVLRNPTDIDGVAASIELPTVRQVVRISSETTGLTFRIDNGVRVSGRLIMPPGIASSEQFQLSLLDSAGSPLAGSNVSFNNSNSAEYSLERVPNGSYALLVQAAGGYGARPLTLRVAGVDLPDQNVQLVQTGIIKGKIAVQQTLPGSTTRQFLLIGQNNVNLLPKSLRLTAEANPWFQGGFVSASPGECGGNFCQGVGLDSNDQFAFLNVLPGTYDVRFNSFNDPNDNSSINLVGSFAPGILVSEGRTTDIGTVNLSASTQLRGTIYDVSTGSAIPNVKVRARASVSQNRDHAEPQATTDTNGQFTLVGLDAAIKIYDIWANDRSRGDPGDQLPLYELKVAPAVDITSISVLTFNLNPAPFTVSGRVVAPAGAPALAQPFNSHGGDARTPGAVVFLQKTSEVPRSNPIGDTVVPTDADGYFVIPALAAGTYKVIIASLDYNSLLRTVVVSTASVNLGTLSMQRGGTLSGQIHKPDGSNPSEREVDFILAATNDLSELLFGSLVKDPNMRTINSYSVSGFRPGVAYRLMMGDRGDNFSTPDEARNIVFVSTTEARTLDIVLRPTRPFALAKGRKAAGAFHVAFNLSQPLRAKTALDDNVAAILSTFSAQGALTELEIAPNRSLITGVYTPTVAESSFTLKLRGYSTIADPESLDPINPEFLFLSTFTFFTGIDGLQRSNVSNVNGGTLLVEGNTGRVAIPSGAFSVDASSSVEVTLQISAETLAGVSASGLKGAAANIASLRYPGSAYPSELLSALAAAPPALSPFSGFYDILLPLGIRTALQKPVQMTISYSSGTDPTTLNLYWYNAAANAYILQQDVTGAAPVIDTVNRTITVNVNHFSTFVLFNTGVAVITGNTFAGGEIEAFNFPNPFDLNVKTVTPTHGAAAQSVRGTMIRFALPPEISGAGSVRIFNVVGERVRTIDLGSLTGGNYFYQPWDGRNDSGRDVASGVYIGQVKVGGKSKFFKMALIK